MKQKSKVCETGKWTKSPCISTVFPFGALAPDGRESGHQWHSRGQRFDPAYLHQRKKTGLAPVFFCFALRTAAPLEYFYLIFRRQRRLLRHPAKAQRFDPAYLHQKAAAKAAAFLFILRYSSAVIQRLLSIPPIPCFNSIPFFGHPPGKSTERDDLRAKLKIFVFSFNYIWINC